MPKKEKKHEILGGIKVSSKQLSEWGKSGGRPQKWTNEAERKRAERLRKKQEKFGEKAELRGYKSYGEIQIRKISITCPNCGKVETDLSKYFNEQGELIEKTWWFDTVRMEKFKVRENSFFCFGCSQTFSFFAENLKVKEVRKIEKRAGNSKERWERWRGIKLVNMSKQLKKIEIKANQKREGKAFGCSEIFTLDNKGKVIKKEWKCEEIKDWKW